MKPVEPVFEDDRILPAGSRTVVYAKDQPEYVPLPAVKLADGEVISRWELTVEEKEKISETGCIYVAMLTFNGPLQPIWLTVEPPTLRAENQSDV